MSYKSIKNLEEVNVFEDLNLHESFRAHMIYEEIVGETFHPKNLKHILIYFYSCVMACNRDLAADFDDFTDWLDIHPTMVESFTNWMIEQLKRKVVKEPDSTEKEAGEKGEPFQN